VLESLDHHAVLLYEVASRLNTVVDLDTALTEVANLVKVPMGADKCEVILAEDFDRLAELGFATSIAHQALNQRSAVIVQDVPSNPALGKSASLLRIRTAMCVPVISGSEVLALIYVYKTRPQARPFDQRDLQLAVAISHQAALTIQRMHLLKRVQREQVASQLLRRFLSPQEADFLLKDYLETGQLPELTERTLTILVADVRDSSGMAERLGARHFGEILGQYYQNMTDVVFKYDGVLNKYLGDGLMAVFGMTEQLPNPEVRAVRVALEMLEQLKSLNQKTGEQIEIGIGINTGSAVAGYLGTVEHVELTVLGDSVNAAWGFESLARPNRVFIGPETFLAVSGEFNILPQGSVVMKNRSQPIDSYEVLPV
jgi:adenylate cyclase